jgi:hypothetical protein
MATAVGEYPRETSWLVSFVTALDWGTATIEELEACGKLVWSETDRTHYLYQHANAGRVCLSLLIDEAEMTIEITAVMKIIYARYGPLEQGRTSRSGTSTAK